VVVQRKHLVRSAYWYLVWEKREPLHSVTMLKFNSAWRFESPGPIPPDVAREFSDLIGKITTQGDVQPILELFKSYFASAAGTTSNWSSSAGWAQTDLESYISEAEANAPLFIEAFYDACESLGKKDIGVPDVNLINRILAKYDAGYQIRPPDLVSSKTDFSPVDVSQEVVSLDRQAQEIIQNSLSRSEKFLAEGENVAAVQELLWLLETISTAFEGLPTESGTVQGKYFNKIVLDLRKHNPGTTLNEVLDWITTLHGYLSAPKGGGIRHGTDIKKGAVTKPHEARLFCNLIRSYIRFLIGEHERLVGNKVLDS
jgi:hypothetical protein